MKYSHNWLYSRNTAIKLYNAKKKRSKYELPFTYSNEDGENEDIDLVDDGAGVDEVVLSKLNSEIVAKYIKQLTIEHQDVIMLVYTLGYSNVEAAKVLGITPNAVGMRLFKAKKKLLELGGDTLHELV